ncbi:SRPBCC family protein [Streptomyces sp. QL37]|uniref:SRPBCC family protein n=1 Tax=Streptomyces sp. QL37 TaxID=2093747 RepID=UPI000CF201F7|nr:SRPBCC family protein [Streptomyces sp. QL37]PPQ56688.1 cyclase [Streptomyces sp. QL37]
MNIVEEAIEVAVPVRTAYNQWTQFKSFPRFMSTVKKVEQIRPNLTNWVIGFGPLRHEFAAEIVEQIPDSHLVWRSLRRRSGHQGEVSFRTSGPDRTEISVRIKVRQHGVGDFCSGFTRRVVRSELAHFKEFIEGLGQEGGAWRGSIHNGHVKPMEPEPPRSRVPHWPVG